jgi:hypothetical protein
LEDSGSASDLDYPTTVTVLFPDADKRFAVRIATADPQQPDLSLRK